MKILQIPSQKITIVLIIFLLIILIIWGIYAPAGLLGKADAIGYAVCHRIDLRSFHLGERALPLCARCSGMYLGAVGGILYQLLRFTRRGGLPGFKDGWVFILLAAAWVLDGVNSYLHFFPGVTGLYEPNNVLRLATGLGMGCAISAILVPSFHQSVWEAYDPRKVFTSWKEYAELFVIVAVLGVLLVSENTLVLYPLALISAGGVILVLSMAYTILWLMLWKKENSCVSWKNIVLPLTAGIITAFAQIIAFDAVRYWFTGTWDGFHL